MIAAAPVLSTKMWPYGASRRCSEGLSMAGKVGMGRGAYALLLVSGLVTCVFAALYSGGAGLVFGLGLLLLQLIASGEYPGIAQLMYAAFFFVVAMLLLAVACMLLPAADGYRRSLPSLLRALIREIAVPARMPRPQPAPEHPPAPKRREVTTWVDTEDGRRLWVDTSNEP